MLRQWYAEKTLRLAYVVGSHSGYSAAYLAFLVRIGGGGGGGIGVRVRLAVTISEKLVLVQSSRTLRFFFALN